MSLQYIIDGYNIVHHHDFAKARKKNQDPKKALSDFIRINRLTGSEKNKVILVFDGYPEAEEKKQENQINIIFSRSQTADEKIKKIVEASGDRKNIIVVSDDKEIRFAVKGLGVKCLSVEEFISPKEKKMRVKTADISKVELTYAQIQQINQEFKKIWLK